MQLVDGYKHFVGNCCFLLQTRRVFYPKDEGCNSLRNVGLKLHYVTSHTRVFYIINSINYSNPMIIYISQENSNEIKILFKTDFNIIFWVLDFVSGFSTTVVYEFIMSSMRAICHKLKVSENTEWIHLPQTQVHHDYAPYSSTSGQKIPNQLSDYKLYKKEEFYLQFRESKSSRALLATCFMDSVT